MKRGFSGCVVTGVSIFVVGMGVLGLVEEGGDLGVGVMEDLVDGGFALFAVVGLPIALSNPVGMSDENANAVINDHRVVAILLKQGFGGVKEAEDAGRHWVVSGFFQGRYGHGEDGEVGNLGTQGQVCEAAMKFAHGVGGCAVEHGGCPFGKDAHGGSIVE